MAYSRLSTCSQIKAAIASGVSEVGVETLRAKRFTVESCEIITPTLEQMDLSQRAQFSIGDIKHLYIPHKLVRKFIKI